MNLHCYRSFFIRSSSCSFIPNFSVFTVSKNLFHRSFIQLNSGKFDPHKVLGVLDTATDEEIRKEYRNLAKKYHPDVCKLPDAEKRFIDIQKAYNMIKDEESRKKTNVEKEYGDVFEGVDLNNLEESEKEIIIMVLNRIRERKSVIGGFIPSSIAYEVSKLRFKGTEYRYTARNVQEKLPPYITMIVEDHWEKDRNIITFNIFSRLEDQHAVGKIVYNLKDMKMDWISIDDKLLATAVYVKSNSKSYSILEKFIVKTTGKVIGAISTRGFNIFPFVNLLEIHPADPNIMPIDGSRVSIFGSRIVWTSQKNLSSPLASAQREYFQPFGKIYDVDISTHHSDVHPALYLFSVVQAHAIERKFSIAIPIRRVILKFLNSAKFVEFSEKQEGKASKE